MSVIKSTYLSCAFILGTLALPLVGFGQTNGFTQPFRTIELASDESGSIWKLMIEEGSEVQEGSVIAQLDDRVQRLQVEAAQHQANATSTMEAARRTLEKRQLIMSRIKGLIDTGHATESEMIRAELEEAIARSRYTAAQEEAVSREIELRRTELLLERRQIRAPFNAVVSKIMRREGEFLSPLRPEVALLIQVDQLLAVFNVKSSELKQLRDSNTATVTFGDGTEVQGSIHSIGVQTDAESGTVQVKVLLDNRDGKLRSGEQCSLTQ